MLIRIRPRTQGSSGGRAEVFDRHEHGIRREDIDAEALKVARRLHAIGHEAYIVGGAVRDLLLGRRPKDFDLVTDAHPRILKRLFRNSRVIGKRFRLVHVFFDKKIIELSTFRSLVSDTDPAVTDNNVYGTMDEDVLRRDFTVNALYYSPVDQELIDFVGGYRDLKARRLKPIIPLARIFTEDPVRMLRAIKYAAGLDLSMSLFLRMKIRRSARLLGAVSSSRLTEELFKALQSGMSAPVLKSFLDYGLLAQMMPSVAKRLKGRPELEARFFADLAELDLRVRSESPGRVEMLAALIKDYVRELSGDADPATGKRPQFAEVYRAVKELLRPLGPANKDVDQALTSLIRKKKPRPRPAAAQHPPRAHHPRDHRAPLGPDTAGVGEGEPRKKRRRRRRPRGRPQDSAPT